MIPLELTLSKIAEKWTWFCETILREEGFAKPRLMFLKFCRVWVSAPQEGLGEMRGGGFGGRAKTLEYKNYLLSILF